jgi:hypothetical protein
MWHTASRRAITLLAIAAVSSGTACSAPADEVDADEVSVEADTVALTSTCPSYVVNGVRYCYTASTKKKCNYYNPVANRAYITASVTRICSHYPGWPNQLIP